MAAEPRSPQAADDRLHFTDSDAANALLVEEPLALLIGFALDQQVTVQKAFMGPLVLRERVGTLDAAALAGMDLEPAFRARAPRASAPAPRPARPPPPPPPPRREGEARPRSPPPRRGALRRRRGARV